MKTIGFSSTAWEFINTDNINDQITFFRSFVGNEINAMELNYLSCNEKKFKISLENFEWLSNFNHISYHLTQWTQETENAISQLPFLDYLICHVDEKHILKNMPTAYLNKVLFENIENHQSKFNHNEKICFDIAHCLSISLEEPENFYLTNKNNIRQIHISNHEDKLKHIPLYKAPGWLLKKIKNIPIKNYPIIIESNFHNLQETKLELQYLKEKIYD